MTKAIVLGETSEATVCTHSEWPWLLLSVLTCFATTILLLAILYVNATNGNQPVWKSSTLPLFFLSLEAWQQGEPLEKPRYL